MHDNSSYDIFHRKPITEWYLDLVKRSDIFIGIPLLRFAINKGNKY